MPSYSVVTLLFDLEEKQQLQVMSGMHITHKCIGQRALVVLRVCFMSFGKAYVVLVPLDCGSRVSVH